MSFMFQFNGERKDLMPAMDKAIAEAKKPKDQPAQSEENEGEQAEQQEIPLDPPYVEQIRELVAAWSEKVGTGDTSQVSISIMAAVGNQQLHMSLI